MFPGGRFLLRKYCLKDPLTSNFLCAVNYNPQGPLYLCLLRTPVLAGQQVYMDVIFVLPMNLKAMFPGNQAPLPIGLPLSSDVLSLDLEGEWNSGVVPELHKSNTVFLMYNRPKEIT